MKADRQTHSLTDKGTEQDGDRQVRRMGFQEIKRIRDTQGWTKPERIIILEGLYRIEPFSDSICLGFCLS